MSTAPKSEPHDEPAPESHCPTRLPRWVPRHTGTRVLWAVVGAAIPPLVMKDFTPALRLVAAWDAFALVLLSFLWAMIWSCDADDSRRRAKIEDPGRTTIWMLVMLSTTVSFFAAGYALRQAHTLAPDRALLWIVLCLGAVVVSWLLTQTGWTLRYAHLFYRDDVEGEGGLCFPGDRPPDDFDFAYFAFTLGMTFQVSDVTVSSRQIRRAVLMHACQSFAYNTAIIALALNLAFTFFV